MSIRKLPVVLLGCLLPFAHPSAQLPTVPVSEVRPGMVATGLTVFEGVTRSEFRAHILGTLENVLGPRRHLILARLEGGPLSNTGVIAGMSGSPVYVGGRLVGAVAYSLGQFSKEPIAGITPIDEMIEATDAEAARSRPRVAVGIRDSGRLDAAVTAIRAMLPEPAPFASASSDVRALSGVGVLEYAAELRPIATPLSIGGVDRAARDLLARVFAGGPFIPVMAAGTTTVDASSGPLAPGDPVGVSFVSGDLSLGATGTVTHVDGRRVYAFGHPFFNLGAIGFPMTRAYVHAIIPSMLSSTKLASLGEIIGTVQQDRATAIAGTLGATPATIPLTVRLESDRGETRVFAMQVASDQFFTPLATFASVASVLQNYEREIGAATFAVTGEARVRGVGAVQLDDVYTGDTALLGAASAVIGPLSQLLRNDLAPVEFERVDLTIRSSEQPRTATIERVWTDEVRPRPGMTLPVHVATRSYRGEPAVRTIPITIPAHARGTLTLLVSDAARLNQFERREGRPPGEATSVPQLIRQFNLAKRANRIYVRLTSSMPGAVVRGEAMPGLPPSVLAVYEADDSGPDAPALRAAPLGEWDIAVDAVVSGSRVLTLTLESR